MGENKCVNCSSIEHGSCTTGTDCKFYNEKNIKAEVLRRTEKELVKILGKLPENRTRINEIKSKYSDDVSDEARDIHFLLGLLALSEAEKNKLVKVVRCSECAVADEKLYCERNEIFVNADDYCSWGELKEE